jgi:hypothetical protein
VFDQKWRCIARMQELGTRDISSTPCFGWYVAEARDNRKLTAVSHPLRQVVGHGNQEVMVGVFGQDGFGPGMVVCFSRIQSGTMQAVLSGGQPELSEVVVAVKQGQLFGGGPQ